MTRAQEFQCEHDRYGYDPSVAAAAIFISLFAISTSLHISQMWKARSWYLTAFIIGGIMETVGYVGRLWGYYSPCPLGPYVIQALLILLGPALFAASIYMILGRIILLTDGEQYSIVRRTWLTKIFVSGDVLSFLVQCGGGGILASADENVSKRNLGKGLILGGLFIQLFFFGFFVIAAAIFQWRGRDYLRALPSTLAWKKHLIVLYITSTLILIRSIFRVIEYIQGDKGYLLTHEVFLYIFDATLMFLVMAAMNIVHPGEIAKLLRGKSASGDFVALESQGGRKNAHQSVDSSPLRGNQQPYV